MKTILVIDVPDDFETKTAIAIVDIKNEKGEGVTAMCPIKPMPKKQEHRKGLCSDFILGFEDGWNDCLEEITGETE